MKAPVHKSDNDRECEVNMTPLIDVSLVLVVMLLLATPLAFESSIGLRAAESSARAAQDMEPVEQVELVLVCEDSVRVNQRLVARSMLGATLQPMLAGGVPRVVVSCDVAVSHGAFVDVLDQAKRSGAHEIGFTGN